MKTLFIKLLLLIGHSGFKYRSGYYRTTGFYYVYKCSDNNSYYHYAACSRWRATHVSGYGVCGVMAEISGVYSVRWTLSKGHRVYDLRNYLHAVARDKDKLKILKSLPKGLTEAKYDEIMLEKVMAMFTKSLEIS
jgi:hypothetical protein